ncbi:MAG: hypothetical protein A2231_04450 [Candidatus Firestonebacteria bacterium RIFOXYA2_FULL_40_8]|nr:MAG: hypothetical protein A2231_04450 [Candidatus Firestonebacteria bacterium RIFOXYA2_FULL_40_8]
MKKKNNIAIFGAGSHIAKGLIRNYLEKGQCCLYLFSTNPGKVKKFVRTLNIRRKNTFFIQNSYRSFMKYSYDGVINCIGAGTLNKHKGDFTRYFTVAEKFDNLIIQYLKEINRRTKYICFSSGVVYGGKCCAPAEENTANCIKVNHVAPEDYYAVTKLYSEAKHRSFKELNIVDLRLFSYFSRYADLNDGYFITEAIKSILNGKVLFTEPGNIVRDYVHPEDLFRIVNKCISGGKINRALDISSLKPVTKQEILDCFSKEYGLKYKVNARLKNKSATGKKPVYYSKYGKTGILGIYPVYNSLDTLKQETEHILKSSLGEK